MALTLSLFSLNINSVSTDQFKNNILFAELFTVFVIPGLKNVIEEIKKKNRLFLKVWMFIIIIT